MVPDGVQLKARTDETVVLVVVLSRIFGGHGTYPQVMMPSVVKNQK